MEFVVGTISLSCELYSLSCSYFRSCGVGTMVWEMVFRFTCAVLWKLQRQHRVFDIAAHACDYIDSGV